MKSVSLHAVIFVFLMSVMGTSGASEWKQKRKARNKHDIAVHMLKSPPKDVYVFKGVTHMPYSENDIMRIVLEPTHMCEIIYQCKNIVPLSVGTQDYTYIQLSGIWPAKGRDVVIQKDVSQPHQISFQHVADIVQPHKKYIRITDLNNTWLFTPSDDGWTKVELTTGINPGGSVPSWLVNAVSVNAPVHTLKNVRKILDKQASN